MAAKASAPPGRIGLFGGSFDPIHNGHLRAAEHLRDALALDRVLLLPAARSPFKRHRDAATAEDRLAMVRLAIDGKRGLEASDIDLQRPGPTYAIDTVRLVQERFPDAELFFLAGMDCLRGLHGWHRVEELLAACRFTFVTRPGFALPPADDPAWGLPPPWPARLRAQSVPGLEVDISSSAIRDRCRTGQSLQGLVPGRVEAYLQKHSLYR